MAVRRVLAPMEALLTPDNPPTEEPGSLRAFCEAEIGAILDRLYGTALRLTRNQADAEDLVADTVVKALDNIHGLQDRNCFHGWIFRILYNTFNSNCRKKSARPEDCFSSLRQGDTEQGEAFWLFDKLHQPFLLWWGNHEQQFLDQLEIEDLCKAVDALPDSYRIVVTLSDIEGFSYQEIAETLEVPVGTVRSRLARGRSMLQKALWDYAQEIGLAPGHAKPQGKDL
jgi:RNA polymerase sigma-70 factor (ECF subfamily)